MTRPLAGYHRMAMEIQCPDCGRPSQVPDGSAGRRARCKCGVEFRIPVEDPLIASLRAAPEAVEADGEASEWVREISSPTRQSDRAPVVPDAAIAGSDNPLDALGISLHTPTAREGRLLVMSPEAVLPDRCIKCDAPADGRRLVVSVSWTGTGTKLLEVALFLVLSVFAHQESRAEIEVGICRRHLRGHRVRSWLAGVIVVFSLGLIVTGIAMGSEFGYALLAGIVMLLATPIYLGLACRLLSAARIESRLVWIKGACPAFLARFPERRA